jgi:hypothetical protein
VVGPALFAFCFLNTVKIEKIFECIKFIFYIAVVLYFFEPGHTIFEFFKISNYSDIFSTHFFTESSLFSELFLQSFLVFNYFSCIKQSDKFNVSKKLLVLSGIMTILCGKRLATLLVIMIPIINKILKKIGKVNLKINKDRVYIALGITFVLGAIIYTNILQGNLFEGFNIYKFSTGRDYILSLWEKYNYISYGYGSSMLIIGRYLELDLIQIYLELNLFSLLVFCLIYMKISSKTFYGLMIMSYAMLNMLTASSLPHTFGWILTLLIVKIIEDVENKIYSTDDTKKLIKM